jgi:glucose/arabinose dehydrogenase
MKTIFVLLLLFYSGVLHCQYKLEPIFQGDSIVHSPVAMEMANDGSGRIFIAQQKGKIIVFPNNKRFDSGKVFLDISNVVYQFGGELGLEGFAFHPKFKENGFFYVNYISTKEGWPHSYISQFHVNSSRSDTCLAVTEKVLLNIYQPNWAHKGGRIEFGPDGYLYIPLGDGGGDGDPNNLAQNLTSLLGKILRIDVDVDAQALPPYAIPVDNPFFQDTSGKRKEIYAYGFRNPFKSSFDPLTGTMWVGDVGQNRFEEIDTIIKGGNYGWRIMEGFHRYTDSTLDSTKLILPLWEYDHWDAKAANAAIIGGFVYRGKLFPKLEGKYIYADYGSARIWALNFDSSVITNQVLVDHDSSGIAISSMCIDGDGNIYFTSISNGRIYKLISTARIDQSNATQYNLHLSRTILDEFNPSLTVNFDLPQSEKVNFSIIDLTGREAYPNFKRSFEEGGNSYQINAHSFRNGIYFLRLSTKFGVVMQKFIVMN